MRMNKIAASVLGGLMTVALSAQVAVAAPSASAAPTVVNPPATANGGSSQTRGSGSVASARRYRSYARYYVRTLSSTASWGTISSETPSLAQAILAVNSDLSTSTLQSQLSAIANDSSLPESVRTSAQSVLSQLQSSGKVVVSNFFGIDAENDNVQKTSDGLYQVTLSIPSLNSGTTGVQVLYYDYASQQWVLITPSSEDLANHQITIELSSLGPVMVLADSGTADGVSDMSTSAKSPKTGVSSDWAGYAGGAVVLAGVGGTLLAVRRKDEDAE